MFTTAAQLLDLTDSKFYRHHLASPGTQAQPGPLEKLLLVLRDGRKLLGVLRSWDQFANLVLTTTTERYFAASRKLFADIPRGTYLVRGENVLLLGEIDLDKDDDIPEGYTEGAIEEVFRLKKEEDARRRREDKAKGRKVGELWGGELEASGEVLF
jgi:U6 snRNA-associated Sm-like protein LSm1